MKRPSPSLLLTIVLLLIAFANPVQAKEQWIKKVQSKNESEKEVRQAATRLEQFHHVFAQIFPNIKLTTPVPTTVVAFKDKKSFYPFKPGNVAAYFQSDKDVKLRKQQEEEKKKQAAQQQGTTDKSGLQNSQIVPTTDTSVNEKPNLKSKENENDDTSFVQVGLYKAKEGENQVRGQLIRVECLTAAAPVKGKKKSSGNSGVVFTIKVGEKLYKFYKPSLANVRLVAFTVLPFGGKMSCGMEIKTYTEVIATFRPQTDKNAKNDGEIILMEFIPKDYPTEP